MSVKIAVVVPAFNADAFLADTIQSVLRQTYTDWSMVIVDDGSTDATAATAAQFDDTRIDVIRQANAGVSAARNAGWHAAAAGPASPDAVLFLDADDWLATDALSLLAEALDAAPRAIAAVARFARVDGDQTVIAGPRPRPGDLLELLLTRNLFANGGHLLIRRSAIETAGDFRTELSYGEDWEYWTRLALLGEFVPVRSATPLLFVHERPDGAYLSRATDPDAYRPALTAIYRNCALADRLGAPRLAALALRAEAEMAWTIGRELIRNGHQMQGLGWLGRSVCTAPLPKRLVLLGLAGLGLARVGIGPFRRYPTVGAITKQ